MFDLSRMTWHSVLGLEMGPCLQYRLPPLLLPWQQSEEMSATPAPTGHLSLRAILNLLSESCTNRSTTCPSLPKRRNSSDRYGSSVLLHSGEKDYTDQLLTLRCFFVLFFCFLHVVWKAALAVAFGWASDTVQQKTLAFTLSWWNYQGVLNDLIIMILCTVIAFDFSVFILFCLYWENVICYFYYLLLLNNILLRVWKFFFFYENRNTFSMFLRV